MITKLAWKNIWFKPLNTLLSILLLAVSVAIISLLILLKTDFENKYLDNLTNIDMVLGAKGSPLQLILSSVYHIDKPTGNIKLEEAEEWMEHPYVEKAVPLALGDNYQGYKIIGTTGEYINLYGNGLDKGKAFENDFEVVIGKTIAEKEGMEIGDKFYGSHGHDAGGHVHKEHTYIVTGIAKPTGKVLDHLVLCNFNSVWDIHHHSSEKEITETTDHSGHLDEHENIQAQNHHHEESARNNLHQNKPNTSEKEITAVLIKLKNKLGFITWPRQVTQGSNMQAASPFFEINRLFSLFGIGISLLQYLAYGIMLLSAISIFITLYTRLMRRKQEFALIRIGGGTKSQLLRLIIFESVFLCGTGYVVGTLTGRLGLYWLSKYTNSEFHISLNALSVVWENELILIAATIIIALAAAIIPGLKAYRLNIPKLLSNE